MRWRLVGTLVAVAVVVAAFTVVPLPDLDRLRTWSGDLGPWFPVAFFLAYALGTVVPIPRSTFTYSSSVLFPPTLAIPLCLGATACSAATTFVLVRHLGYERATRLRAEPRIARIDHHLRRRGWPAMFFLRLVPAVPFAPMNYAAALSSVRFWPFLVATVLGSAPGTIVAILLGNSLTTGTGAGALWASGALAVLGVVGTAIDSRLPVSGGRGGKKDGQTGSVTKSTSRSTAPNSAGSRSL